MVMMGRDRNRSRGMLESLLQHPLHNYQNPVRYVIHVMIGLMTKTSKSDAMMMMTTMTIIMTAKIMMMNLIVVMINMA